MSTNDLLEVYLFENGRLLDDLESTLLICEKDRDFSQDHIADIFRILHTIKGSSAMMNFDNVTGLSHALEDLFGYLREHSARAADHRKISDLVLAALDAIKGEFDKILGGGLPDGDLSGLTADVTAFFNMLVQRKNPPAQAGGESTSDALFSHLKPVADTQLCYKAHIFFEKESKMENIRALGVVKSVETLCSKIATIPADLLEDHTDDEIIQNGFILYMLSDEPAEALAAKIREAFFLRDLKFEELDAAHPEAGRFMTPEKVTEKAKTAADTLHAGKQNYMSVNLGKLDYLLDIVGEIVITESTVTKNPAVLKLNLDSFEKASRQLRKLTDELQDVVMSIRMIPVSATFHKMERIVRDMSNKTDKQANLAIIGEDTELDKNVLDNLADPLMHIVRNAMDHGLEPAEDRIKAGKNPTGQITLEAYNSGSDVIITISDDGRGLDRDALIQKGIERGLIKKPAAEVTDNEAYSLIFAAGFSTKETVTEFSGRGVGMDVASKNIEKLGGVLSVNSTPGQGMTIRIRIPLTLAIIDGMQIAVGSYIFILPLLSMRESFKPNKRDIAVDPDGNEMIHTRGNCYPIIRLHKVFGIETPVTDFQDGIFILLETQVRSYCLFVDGLIGEQQTVVKPLPVYISKILGPNKSIAGCTILGDGSISLILDINGLMS